MKISTRGRYAVRVMVDMAEHASGEYIPLKDIAERQEISLKYSEGIMIALSKSKLVDAVHGKGGGYKLNRDPEDYTVGEILRTIEGDLAPVACLGDSPKKCARASECRTLPMWKDFYKLINDFFDGITLKSLMKKSDGNDYII